MLMVTSHEHGTCSYRTEGDVMDQKPHAYTLSHCNFKVLIVDLR